MDFEALTQFSKYAWLGGYPLYYLTEEGDLLCADCAKEGKYIVCINWEDDRLSCDTCNIHIESAY